MEKPLLGLVMMGIQPSPVIVNTFRNANPGCEVITSCAMADVSPDYLASLHRPSGEYPIFVRLANSAAGYAEIPLEHFAKRVGACVEDLVSRGAEAIAITCAADFEVVDCPVPLIVPGRLLPALVQSLKKTRKIGIVTPNAGQAEAAYAKWRRDGFDPEVVVIQPLAAGMTLEAWADALRVFRQSEVGYVVLDCYSFNDADGHILSEALGRPVLVAREATARAMSAVLGTVARSSRQA